MGQWGRLGHFSYVVCNLQIPHGLHQLQQLAHTSFLVFLCLLGTSRNIYTAGSTMPFRWSNPRCRWLTCRGRKTMMTVGHTLQKVAASPASVWRVLRRVGRLARWKGKLSSREKGFQQPPCPRLQGVHSDLRHDPRPNLAVPSAIERQDRMLASIAKRGMYSSGRAAVDRGRAPLGRSLRRALQPDPFARDWLPDPAGQGPRPRAADLCRTRSQAGEARRQRQLRRQEALRDFLPKPPERPGESPVIGLN
jgi:hypothetical protein